MPQAAQAGINRFGADYTGGVVSNPDLPGPAGQLILNVYLAVDADGTGATKAWCTRPTAAHPWARLSWWLEW